MLLLVRLNQLLQRQIRYLVRMEPGVQPPEHTLENASGSCRDTGWLLVQIMRHLGIAARFASGYLIQLVADVKALDGPSGTDHDFTDLHAWAEAFIPGAGWIGLDPDVRPAGRRGPPAARVHGRSGQRRAGDRLHRCRKVEFEFAMSVTRVHEDPRVTRPYTDAQWQAIDALGEAVDRDLVAHDVRLTQGGEPTFVSIDDMDGAEWNYTALSPKKRELSEILLAAPARTLRARRLRALRPGQVVPGRAAAALGARRVLARRRAAAVARRRADRRHDEAGTRDARDRASVRRAAGAGAGACRPRC